MYANLARHFAGFRSVYIAFIIFTLANLIVFGMLLLWPYTSEKEPGLLGWLWLSADRPWGVVTSNFANFSPEGPSHMHLISNLEGFTFATVFFVIVCTMLKVQDRKRWSRVFLWLVFLSGIISSAIEYPLLIMSNERSWGASGIVYGALGVVLAACTKSLPLNMEILAKEQKRRKRRKKRFLKFEKRSLRLLPNLFSLALLMAFLITMIVDPLGFLGYAPQVDIIAHGLGFLLGFLFGVVLLKLPDRSTRKKRVHKASHM